MHPAGPKMVVPGHSWRSRISWSEESRACRRYPCWVDVGCCCRLLASKNLRKAAIHSLNSPGVLDFVSCVGKSNLQVLSLGVVSADATEDEAIEDDA